MAEYIGCRKCDSTDCKDCNLKNLETMLNNGKFDCLMNGNRCINTAADVAPVQKWISVKDKLPEPEQEVLVCVRSKISNYRYVCCAIHVPENWYRQSSDFCWDFECCDEYDEEQDDYIVKQGWYESIHNWDDYSVVGIEDIVTHWMPIPQPQKGE